MSRDAPTAIEARDLCKTYGSFATSWPWRSTVPAHPVLCDLNLFLRCGDSLGVIGRNGSGKTTLLRLLAGALSPTKGEVRVEGRVATLLDLGAGMDPDFSGRENALLLGVLAGASRRSMQRALPEVHRFSGLGEAFDSPVRTYSSGMTLRLAFAAAIHTDPDVLLIDEVLAVGDAFFQHRCLHRIRQLQSRGCTVVLVTHDLPAVLEFCRECLWLEAGRVAAHGDVRDVVRRYESARFSDPVCLDEPLTEILPCAERSDDSEVVEARNLRNIDERVGDGRARIEGVELRDSNGQVLSTPYPGREFKIVVTVRALQAVKSPIVGFILRDRLGGVLGGENTTHAGYVLPPLERGNRITVEFGLQWPSVATGSFAVCPAIADGSLDEHRVCDWIENAWILEVANPTVRYGWLDLGPVGIRTTTHRED